MVAEAERRGDVAVVVTLTTPFTPEAQLGEAARRRQRTAVADAQQELLDQLAPYGTRAVVRYTATPQLAMAVDLAALRVLLTSRLVARLQHNTPQPPG